MTTDQQDVLVVLPTDRDREELDDPPERYDIHWLDDEAFAYPTPDPSFDMVAYTERCSEYVQDADIDGVVYSHDIANVIAGELCDRHDLPGPGLESMFLTNHKYYSRRHQPDPIWFDYIDLETGEWGSRDPEFPCYVKPPMLTMSLLQHRTDSAEKLDEALDVIRRETPALSDAFHEFFAAYLDTDGYPLATEDIVVVEEPLEEWTQHCVEGWVDSDGEVHVWALSDQNYCPGEHFVVDNYSTPSQLPVELQEELIDIAVETVRGHGVEHGFWNVEIWCQDDRKTVTEINGRAASVWDSLYRGTFGSSIYDAMLYLSCNDDERVQEEAPDVERGAAERVGGQFHVTTLGEGRADDFLDFEVARSIEETDVEIFVDEDEEIEQTRTSGVWLARFHLFGPDHETICERANELRAEMLERPDLSPEPTGVDALSS